MIDWGGVSSWCRFTIWSIAFSDRGLCRKLRSTRYLVNYDLLLLQEFDQRIILRHIAPAEMSGSSCNVSSQASLDNIEGRREGGVGRRLRRPDGQAAPEDLRQEEGRRQFRGDRQR